MDTTNRYIIDDYFIDRPNIEKLCASIRIDKMVMTTVLLLTTLFTCLILLALFGNILVCIAIYYDRNLRKQRENLFLVSLAVSDLFVSLLVMVFAAANDILGYWPFGQTYCKLWVSFDIMCCTASILNLCAIAFDRYWHISQPMVYIRRVSRRRIFYCIIVIWMLSATIGFSQIAFGHHQSLLMPNTSLLDDSSGPFAICELKLLPIYAICSSVLSFFAPATVMVMLYARLYMYARGHVRSIRTQIQQQATTSLLIMQLASSSIVGINNNHKCSNSISTPAINKLSTVIDENDQTLTASLSAKCPSIVNSSSRSLNDEIRCRMSVDENRALLAGNKAKITSTTTAASSSRVSDQKARLTLGVIMGTFLICWLPFFCINVIRSIHPHAIPIGLFQSVTWLGYANSTANPLIYSILNRDFRRAFKRILIYLAVCHHCHRHCCGDDGINIIRRQHRTTTTANNNNMIGGDQRYSPSISQQPQRESITETDALLVHAEQNNRTLMLPSIKSAMPTFIAASNKCGRLTSPDDIDGSSSSTSMMISVTVTTI